MRLCGTNCCHAKLRLPQSPNTHTVLTPSATYPFFQTPCKALFGSDNTIGNFCLKRDLLAWEAYVDLWKFASSKWLMMKLCFDCGTFKAKSWLPGWMEHSIAFGSFFCGYLLTRPLTLSHIPTPPTTDDYGENVARLPSSSSD